jgi:hypothetical protein
MLQLKLNLCSIRGNSPVMRSLRVFDKKSHYIAELAIRAGNFGRSAKRSFYLTGSFRDIDGDWVFVEFPFFNLVNGRLVRNVPIQLNHIL